MKDKLAKQLTTAAMTTKMTTEKKGENKAGAASTPPSPPPPPVAVVIKGGKNATTSLSPTGTLRGYWQAEEETALRAAVQKHGIGAWEKMRTDPDFKALRCARYVFYRDERRATAFLRVSFKLYSSFSLSFSRVVLCAVMMMRETTDKANSRRGGAATKKLSSSMKFPPNVLGAFFSKRQQSFFFVFFFFFSFEQKKEEEEESCRCCCCVFECGSFRWLGDLVVVVVKVESSSVASNLSQKTTFKINAGLSSFTFPKFQGKNRSAAER